ncbi:tyrosine-type recombinase/integrase [Methylacidimicrobium tartarophylax]|uniref:Tyrosine recombinase XerS n=1 Tax=Methylacidimicrobium tartarophylax TaxID=1041768 RepID=A0A5E6MEQ3_9BACT|nr:tyrosine-type recombinase/integrase [Methylacidimicrobium tartarophylax]VVM07595.1 Tyrosine recombinase XerS [Methylacidimicrobium tartarophylax]
MRATKPPRLKKLDPPVLADPKNPNSQAYSYMVVWNAGGKRARKFFASWRDADAFHRSLRQRARVAGDGALSLQPGDAEALSEAKRLIEPYGGNLLDVAREWAERKKRELASVPVKEASSSFLKAKEADCARPRYLKALQGELSRFSTAFAGRKVATITSKELSDWIGGLPVGGLRRRGVRTMLGTFFAYCSHQGWCPKGIIEDVPTLRVKPSKTEVFTPDEASALLEAASNVAPEMVPYLALGLFCGLRTAELDRLDWKDVNCKEVRIEADVAKTASRRVVPILENAAAWIAPYRRKSGPVRPKNTRRTLIRICKAAGVTWRPNAMRHSFASYRLAQCNDAPRVSLELGHMSPAIVFRHYRALVNEEDAKRYFAICPPAASSNVIPIAAGQR